VRFTALLHHITPQLLVESFHALRHDAAAGVYGVTWRDYEEGLYERVHGLHREIHTGAYRAKPSRRVRIPKADGRQRPLGIASLEDKVVQQAVVTVLNTIYEEDFLGFSYGFLQGRSQHDALDALIIGIKSQNVNCIIDADISSFFDEIGHDLMLKFLEHRIADRRMLGLIRKWLKVGVMEDGCRVAARKGTPQGAVISPLLANSHHQVPHLIGPPAVGAGILVHQHPGQRRARTLDSVFAPALGALDHARTLEHGLEPAVAALALEFLPVLAVKVRHVPARKAALVQLHDPINLGPTGPALGDLA
jgi:hypothetical protein